MKVGFFLLLLSFFVQADSRWQFQNQTTGAVLVNNKSNKHIWENLLNLWRDEGFHTDFGVPLGETKDQNIFTFYYLFWIKVFGSRCFRASYLDGNLERVFSLWSSGPHHLQVSHAVGVSAGPDKRAWPGMTRRCGSSCSRRRTGSAVDWSSSPQRLEPQVKAQKGRVLCYYWLPGELLLLNSPTFMHPALLSV